MVYGTMAAGLPAGLPGKPGGVQGSEEQNGQDRATPLAAAASLQLSASAASDTHTTVQRPAAACASGGETGRGLEDLKRKIAPS